MGAGHGERAVDGRVDRNGVDRWESLSVRNAREDDEVLGDACHARNNHNID